MNPIFGDCNDAFTASNTFLDPISAERRLPFDGDNTLTRYLSSDADSFTSSTPTSPLLGVSFPANYGYVSSPASPTYTQFGDGTLLAPGSPNSSQANSPRICQDDLQGEISASIDQSVCCLYPGCDIKKFKRRADLDRHYKHRHAPESKKTAYFCDYPKCGRKHDPFHRRDHFRDHLREFHKEVIEKRGSSSRDEILDDRSITLSWWRCAKCLSRNKLDKSNYDCSVCKTESQLKRKLSSSRQKE